MKRNLVFLLTGFLAISSLSAGLPSYQVMAAEADGSSEYAQQAEISFLVMDENGIILDQGSQYSLTEGETCVIDVFWDDLPADTLPVNLPTSSRSQKTAVSLLSLPEPAGSSFPSPATRRQKQLHIRSQSKRPKRLKRKTLKKSLSKKNRPKNRLKKLKSSPISRQRSWKKLLQRKFPNR